ncbi:MAG: hypothetical protein HOW73_08515 [Polyangiaceae bacterium]|nr:hypothetical protein [Polyangiaceae bacterium]
MLRTLAFCVLVAAFGCADGGGVEDTDGGGGGTTSEGGGPDSGSGGHGCFETESFCGGACVDVSTHAEHCGECDHSCSDGVNQTGQCVGGECVSACEPGFVDDQGTCKNFFGAHEPWPAECAGCSQANVYSGDCTCPSYATELTLHLQSDCPGVPMRAATTLGLCVTSGVSTDADFGGAYQVDDGVDLCGATAQCRVGNPLAGNMCACPDGFADAITLRSIVRLPCDGTETGTNIVLCGNQSAPFAAFGGAYQFDDFEPNCRVANPWTGDCTCPAGTVDRSYRIMVDHAAGLVGSSLHLCTL